MSQGYGFTPRYQPGTFDALSPEQIRGKVSSVQNLLRAYRGTRTAEWCAKELGLDGIALRQVIAALLET